MDAVEPFSVDRGTVLGHLLLAPSSGWPVWAVAGAGILLIAAGCLADVRCLVLGMMLLVAVVPCVGAFIYFSRTLAPEMVANMLPHTLERNPDGYRLRIWRRGEPESPDEAETEWVESGSISLSDSDIVDRKRSGDYEMLYFKDSGLKILYVPRF